MIGSVPQTTMSRIVSTSGRILLGSIFIVGGEGTYRNPAPRAEIAEGLLEPIVRIVPMVTSVEQIVRYDALAKVAGGALLMSGRFTRVAATGLVMSLVPTTLAAHDYWTLSDPRARAAQRTQFFKNLSNVVGLLLVAAVPTTRRTNACQPATFPS